MLSVFELGFWLERLGFWFLASEFRGPGLRMEFKTLNGIALLRSCMYITYIYIYMYIYMYRHSMTM